MKKRVLFFACLCMLFSLGAKAQVFTLETNEIPAITDGDVNSIGSTIKSNSYVSLKQSGVQGIVSSYLQLGNTNANLNLTVATNDALWISSTVNISKIVVYYRPNNDGANARPYVGFHSAVPAEGATAATVTSCILGASHTTTTFTAEEFPAPANTKFVILARGASCEGSSSTQTFRLNRIEVYAENNVLPLEFLSFTAKPDALGKTVNLNWKTANEVNTQDFVIERRSDDTEFAVIDVVPSKNVSGTHSYSFTDIKPLVGNSYYRLKQRDSDGKFNYSDIFNVKIEGIALSLHPNPVGKELVVSHEYAKKPLVLKVLGLDGKIHIKTNTHIGASSSTINVASLASGTYLLVFEGEGKPKSQKFIKK